MQKKFFFDGFPIHKGFLDSSLSGIECMWKAGEELTADALTKILPRARLEKLRSKLGVLVSRKGR